ncbi:MAG: DNA repair protein RecN, partial [Dehalococcoidia bacterium]
ALKETGVELDGDGSVILFREIREHGRSIARVNGRAVPVSLLQELGQLLVDVHSQREHISLLNPQRQLDLLDSYGGLLASRSLLGRKVRELRDTAKELGALTDRSTGRRRELLEYQVAEIDGAEIDPDEYEALEQEGHVLQRAQAVKEGCCRAYSALYADELSASCLIHKATGALREIIGADSALGLHLEGLESAVAELEDRARELRCYAEGVESRSGCLEQVERRLEGLRHLKSKYGLSLSDVLDFGNRAREELEGLKALEERLHSLEEERQVIEGEVGELAEELSCARQEAARTLTELANRELSELGMAWAKFEICVGREEHPDGLPACNSRYNCSQYGIDRVVFLGATNPGEPLRPLADIASGGETCRFMLALKAALHKADPVPTLVFDEIDSGIGGRNARIVGGKLAALARDRQVICITHLPQIACFGQGHYRVLKEVSSGRASACIEQLQGDSRLEELAAMLGSAADSSMLESARELLRHAESREKDCVTASVS